LTKSFKAKDEVMNKKYQMMVDNIQANLYHYDQNDSLFSHSLSHTVTIFYHSVMSCSRQGKVQTDWFVDFFLAAGSSAADQGQAKAKCLRPRPRPKL